MQSKLDGFFKRVPKADEKEDEVRVPKKRKKVIISSDEEEISESPSGSKARDGKKVRPNEEKSSSKRESKKTDKLKSKEPVKELKKIDPNTLFGVEAKRKEAPKPLKPKEAASIELDDDDIDKSLLEVDVQDKQVAEKSIEKKRTKTSRKDVNKSDAEKKEKGKTPKKDTSISDHKSPNKKTPFKESAKQEIKVPTKRNGHHLEVEEDRQKKKKESHVKKTPIKDKGSSSEEKTPSSGKRPKTQTSHSKKGHDDDHDSTILTDEERHERKRRAAILYQQYKNRSSCLNPGSKEVPKGKPNCLAGFTFLVTGILESIERDEANSIIKEYGGKVMTVVGKRLNYLIVGEEAGPKKLAQADEFGITVLSEDGLFDLIRERSGEKVAKGSQEKSSKTSSSSQSNKKTTPVKDETKVKTEKKTPKMDKTESRSHKESSGKSESSKIKKETSDKSESLKIKKETSDKSESLKIKKETSDKSGSHSKKSESKKENDISRKPSANENMMAWVDKYKPTNVKEIIGQQGAASNVVKLTNWLSKWYSNHDGKKKLQKPNPWAKNDDGSYYKAALLSGPPGIGKTTTANLVCKELGFDVVEFNASDTRSKRLLKEEVSELLSNKSLFGFCHGDSQAVSKKHILIMDEVDGMAGNEDRGGIQELISLIKDSSVPIICMCNDRNHQKMRSLVNYCYDLRFQRPRLEQIKGRLLSILCKENVKVDAAKLEEIISASNNDIRQSINYISMLSTNKDLDLKSQNVDNEKTAEKDMKMGPWDVVRKVFSADEHKRMTIYDKCDLFFHDYSLAPLFVQQNYLQVSPHGPKTELLDKIAMTADSLSLGDLVDKRIRSRMAWSLLPTMAVFSSYMPGEFMCGHFTGQINFPGWLGKHSRANKRSRLAQEIHDHTRLRTSGSRLSIRLDYAPFLLNKIVRPLKELGSEGVEESLNVLKEYHLLREDIDSLLELTAWPGKKQAFEAVDGRVKAALTRSYNKEVLPYSYSAVAGVKKKRAEAMDENAVLLGEDDEPVNADSDDDKDDNLENDGLIKAKKKTATAAEKKGKAQKESAGTSKGKGGKASGSSSKSKGSNSKAKK